MNTKQKEPTRLRKGREFHESIQTEWNEVQGSRREVAIHDLRGRRRRVDILIDEGDDWLSVIEVKRTDWDSMAHDRVRPNALRHARQLWRYIETFLDRDRRDVCPGVIYKAVPTTPGRVATVESALHERGIQVVWHSESLEELQQRMGVAP